MSWTNISTVQKHLIGYSVDGILVKEYKIILADEDIQLIHRNIQENSVRVAMVMEAKPVGPSQVVLLGTTWHSIGYSDLLLNSVAVTSDSMLTERYVEGIDYVIDHLQGNIKRLDTGSITNAATVYVWCIPLTVFEIEADYKVKHEEGIIQRVPAGDIPEQAVLLIDYATHVSEITDSLISQAIVEAEDKILARLRDGYDESSTDQGLKTGATELTLSIICDDLGLQALCTGRDHGADDRARRYMDLARRYEDRAASTLARFLTQPLQSEARSKSNPSGSPGW